MGQPRANAGATVAPSQAYLLNVCGFQPREKESLPLLRMLYGLADIDPYREIGPSQPCQTPRQVKQWLQHVRGTLLKLRGPDLKLEFRILLHMRPDLEDIVDVVRVFRDQHMADMRSRDATSRFRLDKDSGRNLLVLDQGQAEDPATLRKIADHFGGVYEAPLGKGGVLLTDIGGLITVSCGISDESVSHDRYVAFMNGSAPLPSRSGVRQRTRSGRLITPEPNEESAAFQEEPPTKPALRRRTSFNPVEAKRTSESLGGAVPITTIVLAQGAPSSPEIEAVRPRPEELVEVYAADAEDKRRDSSEPPPPSTSLRPLDDKDRS